MPSEIVSCHRSFVLYCCTNYSNENYEDTTLMRIMKIMTSFQFMNDSPDLLPFVPREREPARATGTSLYQYLK